MVNGKEMDDSHTRAADITLLLEGTYPFVRGGVSSWVHQLIQGLPEFTFSLIFLGSTRASYDTAKYELPDNVTYLGCHYLMEPWEVGKPKAYPGKAAFFTASARLHDYFRDPDGGLSEDFLQRISLSLVRKGGITVEDFLYSKMSWEQICERYRRFCSDTSFIDYFWTIRNIHGPLFKLAKIVRRVPPTRVFHSISTGYAGFLGTLAGNLSKRPFILTEHGIYTKERKIDLQSVYIKDQQDILSNVPETGMAYHQQLWVRFFEGIGRLTYASADPIISLYDRNRQRQIKDGADASRTLVIPNGIDLKRFSPLRARRPKQIPPILGLIGRIVPIKDIKTFIRAMRTICSRLPEAEGWLIGPEDEDKEYARECKNLVLSLGLERQVKFLGFQNIETILPQLGLLALTSISEAFPLVLLEAFASGLPGVTTDVGACREVIEGKNPEDRALGSAGAVIPIADPDALAREALALLTEEVRWRAAQMAGIRRVERYYTQSGVFERYREIYQMAMVK
jgi:glycosyltransferase involved in cell wall biosynthesis